MTKTGLPMIFLCEETVKVPNHYYVATPQVSIFGSKLPLPAARLWTPEQPTLYFPPMRAEIALSLNASH